MFKTAISSTRTRRTNVPSSVATAHSTTKQSGHASNTQSSHHSQVVSSPQQPITVGIATTATTTTAAATSLLTTMMMRTMGETTVTPQAPHHRHRGGRVERTSEEYLETNDTMVPPFLPLEEDADDQEFARLQPLDGSHHYGGEGDDDDKDVLYGDLSNAGMFLQCIQTMQKYGKTAVATVALTLFTAIVWDSIFRSPKDRLLSAETAEEVLLWVQLHPLRGIVAIVWMMAACVVFMIPIGTPLTVGAGYIYKGAYGWRLGLTVATVVAMGGSALGAVICFLLGRYLMRDQVRKWIRKYPLFDAIDIAAAEHGLRIMAMLYLTPILPLGPVSYMCGTTSMSLSSFVLAKIASLPLMLLYAFIGASTGTLLGHGHTRQEMKKIEENRYLIVAGILLSLIMITGITHYIKKELNQILERQEKHKPGEMDPILDKSTLVSGIHLRDSVFAMEEAALEMGTTSAANGTISTTTKPRKRII